MADIPAKILTEIRDEAREARAETRENFKVVFHRFALLETTNAVEAGSARVPRAVTGGAAYDALVAATAAGCDAELVTCDRRALPVYERYGLRAMLLS